MPRRLGVKSYGFGPGARGLTSAAAQHGPNVISISATSFSNTATIGTVVGNLTATDYDAGTTYTWSIPSGGNPSGYFGISGNQVNLAQGAVPSGSYNLTIRCTDSNSRTKDATFSLTSATTYSAEATALFAAMTTQPNATRKGQIDTFIGNLKTHGVWTMLDLLYVPAAHDQQAALLNWVKPGTYNLTEVGTPGWTTDRGYTGLNGSAKKLTTGFNPTTAPSPKFTQNSCSIGAYIKTNSTTLYPTFGNTNSRVVARTNAKGNIQLATASTAGIYAGNATAYQGFFQGRRVDSANQSEWLNLGSSGVVSALASSALTNQPFELCGAGDGTASSGSPHEVRLAYAGSGMVDNDVINMYNDVVAYLTAIGANLTSGLA